MKEQLSVKNEIMSQIRSEKIKMRARWFFVAQKIGLRSGLTLTLLFLIFLLSAFMYYLKGNGLLSYHSHQSFLQKLLQSLPYDLILLIIALLAVLNYFVKQFDFSYRHPFTFVLTGVVFFIVFWATLLFVFDFNSLISRKLDDCDCEVPIVSEFYLRRVNFVNSK